MSHPLTKFIVVQRHRIGRQVFGHEARKTALHLVSHGHGGAELPRGAVTALEAVMLNEGPLQRVQGARYAQPFDGRNGTPLILHRERQAGVDPLTVGQDGARPAGALIAALFRAGQAEMIAQQIQQ